LLATFHLFQTRFISGLDVFQFLIEFGSNFGYFGGQFGVADGQREC
jgi:hypothetical protein